MKFLGVIPARYASTRLEGKPLKDICGHSMIEWVYRRCQNTKLDDVIVATDDERIFQEVKKFGGKVLMTSSDRKSTRLNSSHANISYAVFCLKKKTLQSLHYLVYRLLLSKQC